MARRTDPVSKATGFITGIAGRIIIAAALVFLFFRGVTITYSFGHGLLYEHGMDAAPGTKKTVSIGSQDGSAEIADTLLKEGLIDNKAAFRLQAILYQAEFEPGTYELDTSMSIEDILTYLTDEAVKQRELESKNLAGGQAGIATTAADEENAGAETDSAETGSSMEAESPKHQAGGNAGAEADEIPDDTP